MCDKIRGDGLDKVGRSLNNFINSTMPEDKAVLTLTDSESSDSESCSSDEDTAQANYCSDSVLDDFTEVPAAECLFCPFTHQDTEYLITTHLQEAHGLCLQQILNKLELDEIECLKMVNYFRKTYIRTGDQEIVDLSSYAAPFPWEDDEFLIPVKKDDQLLVYYWGGLVNESSDDLVEGVKEEDPKINAEEVDQIRLTLAKLLEGPIPKTQNTQKLEAVGSCESKLLDTSYFESYADIDIHHSMLTDIVRTIAYEQAILGNCEDFEDKYVMDVGCGTGILSMFAAKAGAKVVVGVDRSDILQDAYDIIRENKLSHKIFLVSGCVEEVSIPVLTKVDIIISEWMGYFLLFEGMLSSVIHARDKYLRPGGLMLPNACQIMVCGVEDFQTYNSHIGLWDDVYGFKMSTLKKRSISTALVSAVSPDKVATTEADLLSLNLMTCSEAEASGFQSSFKLKAQRDSTITALVGYFNCDFSMGSSKRVILKTGPKDELTHWNQTIFFIRHPLQVKADQVVTGTFTARPAHDNARHLSLTVVLEGQTLHYSMR